MSNPIRISEVQFVHVVSFGGQIKSASGTSPGRPDRPGSKPHEILFDPESMTFSLTGKIGPVMRTKYVHVSNVSGWEVAPPEEKKEEAAKKTEVKK